MERGARTWRICSHQKRFTCKNLVRQIYAWRILSKWLDPVAADVVSHIRTDDKDSKLQLLERLNKTRSVKKFGQEVVVLNMLDHGEATLIEM